MFGLRQQPRAFYMIFMLEIWERFGFYTTQGILTLYFIRFLKMSRVDAYYTYGVFFALIYGMVSFGGFLGDRVLGTKRSIIFGLSVLAAGYLALALVESHYVFYALGLIAVGNGLFKANPSNLLSTCFTEDDPRLHEAFTLYYMAINLGAIFALLLGPFVASHFSYSYAYFLSFIGIILGILNYIFHRKDIRNMHTSADGRPVSVFLWCLILMGVTGLTYLSAFLLQHPLLMKRVLVIVIAGCLIIYLRQMRNYPLPIKKKMMVALVLMAEGVSFFTLYQQMPTSLTLFVVHHVRTTILGYSIDPQSFQALNAIWIVTLAPVLATVYARLSERGIHIPVPYKFAIGMGCCGISFTVLFFARYAYNESIMVSPLWVVVSYCFQSLGELFVSALGVAMVAELVPRVMRGFVMGMWFFTSSIAGFTGAFVASLTHVSGVAEVGLPSLLTYTNVFGAIGLSAFFVAIILVLIAPYLSRMSGNN